MRNSFALLPCLHCLFLVTYTFGQVCPTNLDPDGPWNHRLSIIPCDTNEFLQFAAGGIGRKVAISEGNIIVGTGRSENVLTINVGCREIGETIDPFEDGSGVTLQFTEEESFGYAVAIARTTQGTKVVVGDTGHSDDEQGNSYPNLFFVSPGQAHVFDLDEDGTLTKEVDFINPFPFRTYAAGEPFNFDINVGSQFGHDVAIDQNWAAVGAPFDGQAQDENSDPFGLTNFGSGKAFAFDIGGAFPNQTHELVDPSEDTGERFGSYVAVSNGLIAVSDHVDSDGAGAVYIYDTSQISVPGQSLDCSYAIPRSTTNMDAEQFGWDTDMYGDLLLVGHTRGASLYRLTPQNATFLFTITSPETTEYDEFGRIVALDGNRIAVAQQGVEIQNQNPIPGIVFVYNYDSAYGTYDPQPEARFEDPTFTQPENQENYPSSLDINGTLLCVGSARQRFYAGEVYVYNLFTLGDMNFDGVVDILDAAPFSDVLAEGKFQIEADINGDGTVNVLDVDPFVNLIVGN